MGFFSNLFNKIGQLLRWLGDLIVKIVVIALIVAAIYFVFIGAYLYAALLLIAAFLVHPGIASAFVSDVAGAAGDVAGAVAEVAGEVLDATTDAFFNTDIGRATKFIGLGILGVWGASTLLSASNSGNQSRVEDVSAQNITDGDFSGV